MSNTEKNSLQPVWKKWLHRFFHPAPRTP